MGQIRGKKAKVSACNIRSLSSFGTPYAGMHILVSTDNSATEDGQGNFDAYVVGDGKTAATALPLLKTYKNDVDDTPTYGSEKLITSGGVDETLRYPEVETGEFANGYYNTNASTLPSIRNNLAGCQSAKISVVPGEVYMIYGKALNHNYYRFYAFYDASGNRIDRYASTGTYRDAPLTVVVPASAVTMTVNLGEYASETDKVLKQGKRVDFTEIKETLDAHSDDIATIGKNEVLIEDFVSSITFSRCSEDGHCKYEFGQDYSIQNEGDYFELKTRYYGDTTGSADKLYFLSNGSLNGVWGFYSADKIYFRVIDSDSYLIYTIPQDIDYKDFHVYKMVRTASGFALYIDGVLIEDKPYTGSGVFVLSRIGYSSNTLAKYDIFYLTVSVNGVATTFTDFWKNGVNIKPIFYVQNSAGTEAEMAKYYKYDAAAKEMKVYTKLNKGYAEFTIKLCTSRDTANDPIYYRYFWEIQPDCRVCTLENGQMIPSSKKIIVGGESECVIRATNYDSTDFTGGVHGDESIDVDASCFVEFLADGKVIDISQSTELIGCNSFEYRQLSALHKTAKNVRNKETSVPVTSGTGVVDISSNYTYTIDGVDTGIGAYNVNSVFSSIADAVKTDNISAVDGGNGYWKLSYVREIDPLHTIIGYHSKVTSFDAGYRVRNGLTFTEDGQAMSYLWYVGILCLAKEFASEGYNDALNKVSFTGTNTHLLTSTGLSRYYAKNPTNGLSAIIDSKVIDGQGVLSNEANTMHIWDRDIDSKYYNGTPIFTPNEKTLVGEMSLLLND